MANQEAPVYERRVSAEPGNTPDLASSTREYAANTNWMSAIGSTVATKSSEAIATQLGAEAGKNPRGTLPPSFTAFDKNFEASYTTQAHSTLGLQANKLISDSNIALAKASRITPDLIKEQQKQVNQGLEAIYKMAPTSIRPQMELQYGSTQISQTEQLTNRMINEQHTDQRNQTALASQVNSENAHALAMAGDDAAAEAAVQATIKANKAGAGVIDPLVAKVSIDTARISMLSGKYTRGAINARAQGKEEEYLRNLADKRPSDLSDADYPVVTSHVMQYMQHQENLRKQDEALRISRFQLSQVTDINGITGEQIADLKANLPETEFNNAMIGFEKAKIAAAKAQKSTAMVVAGFGDPNQFAVFTDKEKLAGLNELASKRVNESAITGSPVSLPEAEMQVAATAAGPIQGYINKLNLKAASGVPQQLNEASAAIDYISKSGSPQNIIGLSPEALAMTKMYDAFRDSHDEVTAAQMAKEVVYNKTPEQRKANDDNFKAYYENHRKTGQTPASFALQMAGIESNVKVNVPQLSQFVADKFEGYFKLSNGDVGNAQKMLKHDIDNTFGYTSVNGDKEYAYLPINKVYNLPDNANGFIHEDLHNQLNKQFASTKEAYDKGLTDFYWDVKPKITMEEFTNAVVKIDELTEAQKKSPVAQGLLNLGDIRQQKEKYRSVIEQFNASGPPEIFQHFRDGSVKKFEAVIQSSPGLSRANVNSSTSNPINGYYDINIKTPTSVTSIVTADPHAGPMRYVPDRARIMGAYNHINSNYNHYTNSSILMNYGDFVKGNVTKQLSKEDKHNSVMEKYVNWVKKNVDSDRAKNSVGSNWASDYAEFVKKNIRNQ